MRILALLLLVLTLVGSHTPASAFSAFGPPIEGNSWSQYFNETGVGLYDFIRVDYLSGGLFEPPVFSGFTTSGWTAGWAHPQAASASGPATSNMSFYITFEGLPADKPEFVFSAYAGTTLKEAAWAKYDGGWNISVTDLHGWTVPEFPGDDPLPDVPEPGTMMLLSTALGVGALFMRNRIRR